MARAGFGGAGDFSGFFSNLYSSNRQTKDAEQAAADADAQDQWNNGLMTDEDWLAYIANRIAATASDPKQHQQWVTAQRKYTVAIADNQAEFTFKNGGSINDLIGYYQGRLGTLAKDSNEYRDVQLRVNDLIDQRASKSIQDGAQAIIDRITAGKGTYAELKAFLQDGLKQTRPNSDLYDSITKQIQQVDEQVRSNKVEGTIEKLQYRYDAGQISAKTYAASLKQQAQQFKAGDPKRYYQMLEAAVALGKVSGSGGGGGGGGGGGYRGGGSRTTSTKTINKHIDTIKAQQAIAQSLIDQYEKGAKVGVNPQTGKPYVFNEQTIHALDKQLLGTFDAVAAAERAKGDKSAAANAMKAKSKYISIHVVKHNTMAADDQSRELMTSTNKILQSAQDDPDPVRAMGTIRALASDWSNFSDGLVNNHVSSSVKGGIAKRLPESDQRSTVSTPRQGTTLLDADYVGRSKSLADAFTALADPNTTPDQAASVLDGVQKTLGGDVASGLINDLLKPVADIRRREESVVTGSNDVVRVATPDGKLQWVDTVPVSQQVLMPDGSTQIKQAKVPDISGVDGKKQKLVDVYMDVNGKPTKVQAVAQLSGVNGFDVWTTQKSITVNGTKIPAGAALTQAQITQMGQQNFEGFVKAGSVKQEPGLNTYQVTIPGYTDANGTHHDPTTWSQDIDTGLWYNGALPVRGAQRDRYGAVEVGDSGPMIDWGAYGSAAGVPTPYSGVDAKGMQDIANGTPGLFGDVKGRDGSGNVTTYNHNPGTAYYDPSSYAPPAKDNWWDDSQRNQRAQDIVDENRAATQKWLDSQGRGNQPVSQADEVGAAVQGLLGIAKSFGISIGGTETPSTTPRNIRGRVIPQIPTMPREHPNKDVLELPTVAPKTYSGPQVAPGQRADVALALPTAHPGPAISVRGKPVAKPAARPKPVAKPIRGRAPKVTPKVQPYDKTPTPTGRPGTFRGL